MIYGIHPPLLASPASLLYVIKWSSVSPSGSGCLPNAVIVNVIKYVMILKVIHHLISNTTSCLDMLLSNFFFVHGILIRCASQMRMSMKLLEKMSEVILTWYITSCTVFVVGHASLQWRGIRTRTKQEIQYVYKISTKGKRTFRSIFWFNFVFVPKQTQLKSLNVIRT